ncbi:hypothetical protein EOA35_14385 [Mesorhizobium sp. M8A.F.Ca.ET.023.01.1.1]|nr:hypothetical protein EOA35_14385 [Mesorhizobium sp. M8A.F.Ca.ET.023.01.1.1]
MRHPGFDPNLRDLVLALDEKRGEATVADLAEIVGIGAEDLIRRIIGETVFAEYRRLVAEAAPRAN